MHTVPVDVPPGCFLKEIATDGTIAAVDLTNLTVDSTKISALAIDSEKIAKGSVNSEKILDDSVDTGKLTSLVESSNDSGKIFCRKGGNNGAWGFYSVSGGLISGECQ
mgnify:CR=1 FL=1